MSITFFFGAGAECSFGLPAGKGFISPLLQDQFKDERKAILGDKTSSFQLVPPNSKKVYAQTIHFCKKEAKKYFEQWIIENCDNYYNGSSKKLNIPYSDWYKCLHTSEEQLDTLSEEKKNQREFFLENAVFFDTLDEKFNDLRNDPLGANGKRVLNAYFTILILMLDSLYQIPGGFDWKLDHIYQLLKKDYDRSKLLEKKKGKSYYQSLSDSGLSNYSVITSNYTEIISMFLKDVVFLHGKLTWFEDYKHRRFYDVSMDDDIPTENVVPFIMIPSGVKPIICKRQLDEFQKFTQRLFESNYLCVVGYKFNSEDNHINAIIGEWLRVKGNKLIYLNYKENNSYLDICKYGWASGFTRKVYDEKEVTDRTTLDLKAKEQIIDIHVNKSNCNSVFESLLMQLHDT